MAVAASFGLASALSVVVLGDESGYMATENQKMKIAAIEAMWQTEPAPAAFTVFGIPDRDARETDYAVTGPLGARPDRHALARHGQVAGIDELVADARDAHRRAACMAYGALRDSCARDPDDAARRATASRRSQATWATRCC